LQQTKDNCNKKGTHEVVYYSNECPTIQNISDIIYPVIIGILADLGHLTDLGLPQFHHIDHVAEPDPKLNNYMEYF